MIDFHSHILPGIDDGSQSYEQSKKIILEAKEQGFDKIISTSHYAVNCYEIPEYKRKEMVDDLNSEKDFPKIFLGSEIFMTFNIINLLEEYNASSINGSNYILFELPLRQKFNNLKDIIYKLKEHNYKLILAHPERYSVVQNDFNYLYELNDLDILFQCNYGSIVGVYGIQAKQVMKKMLKQNLVTFLGSDVHRENSIYPKVPKALQKISKIISQSELDDLTTYNAEAVLNNENI